MLFAIPSVLADSTFATIDANSAIRFTEVHINTETLWSVLEVLLREPKKSSYT